MQIFRIAKEDYILDLSGEGARIHGGRWNRPGIAVVYAASSVALAAWEVRVHLGNTVTPKKGLHHLATITIHDDSVYAPDNLPEDWPNQEALLFWITDNWIRENKFLCMKVPSAIIKGEFNYLINPLHPLASDIEIISTTFEFDDRTFGKNEADDSKFFTDYILKSLWYAQIRLHWN